MVIFDFEFCGKCIFSLDQHGQRENIVPHEPKQFSEKIFFELKTLECYLLVIAGATFNIDVWNINRIYFQEIFGKRS